MIGTQKIYPEGEGQVTKTLEMLEERQLTQLGQYEEWKFWHEKGHTNAERGFAMAIAAVAAGTQLGVPLMIAKLLDTHTGIFNDLLYRQHKFIDKMAGKGITLCESRLKGVVDLSKAEEMGVDAAWKARELFQKLQQTSAGYTNHETVRDICNKLTKSGLTHLVTKLMTSGDTECIVDLKELEEACKAYNEGEKSHCYAERVKAPANDVEYGSHKTAETVAIFAGIFIQPGLHSAGLEHGEAHITEAFVEGAGGTELLGSGFMNFLNQTEHGPHRSQESTDAAMV
jgi:hypothetical protein